MTVFIITVLVFGILYLINHHEEAKREIKMASSELEQSKRVRERLLAELEKRFGKVDTAENANNFLMLSCKIPFIYKEGNNVSDPVRKLTLNLKYNPNQDRVIRTVVTLKLYQMVSNQMVNASENIIEFASTPLERDSIKIAEDIIERINVMRMSCNTLLGLCEDWE